VKFEGKYKKLIERQLGRADKQKTTNEDNDGQLEVIDEKLEDSDGQLDANDLKTTEKEIGFNELTSSFRESMTKATKIADEGF
jgi:hypothetical protein